ncbi:MAG: DUF4398 domain-containing protein [Deltaproteobacteria bacterium]|nr:DUF4398 domain-containing protein [Deltaproteobacteria bacterium]
MGTIFDVKHGMMWRPKTRPPLPVITCLILLATFQALGCSMTKPPTEALARAELTLRTATEARANELAPTDLQRAMEKLEASKKALAAGKNDEARRLAETAQVEAELAEAKADAEIMRLAADKLRQRGDALRQEMESAARSGSPTAKPGSK